MNHLALKKRLLEEYKKHQQKVIDNLKSEIKEAQESANEYGAPKDRYDSFRMQLLRKKDMFAQQMEKAVSELYALEKIDSGKEMDVAGFGSVIITANQKIFISIGIGKLKLDEDTFLAVSLMSPLSKAFVGKRKGDIVEFNEKKIEILEVF